MTEHGPENYREAERLPRPRRDGRHHRHRTRVRPRKDHAMSTRYETHVHCWERRQNVTSKGYVMTPIEVCAEPECGAARIVGGNQPAQRNGAPPMSAEVTLTEDEREQRCRSEKISHEHYTRETVERIVAARVEQARADERKRCANAIEDDVNTHAQFMTPGERLGALRAARVVRRLVRTA